jgi:hypothetical protein
MELGRDAFSEVFMIPLPSAVSAGFTWSKLPRNRGYELKLNGDVVGRLHRPSCWSTKFLADTQNGRWRFRRSGFLGTGSEILDLASEHQIATFKSAWGNGGALTFADGQTFQLGCKGWWRPVWTVTTGGGQPVARLHVREKTVELETGAAVPENRWSLLILFAWYRVLQAEEDAAAAAVATVVAS